MIATTAAATLTTTAAVAAQFLMVGEVVERAGVLYTVAGAPLRDELARTVSYLVMDENRALHEIEYPMGLMVPLWT